MSEPIVQPWPKLFRDVKGLRVRTRFALGNHHLMIPAGTLARITGGPHWAKMDIQAEGCKCCGVAARMSGVEKYALEVIAE